MDIAAMSTMASQAKVQQQAGISIMKMAMDAAKAQAADLAQMMERTVNPNLGGNVDIKL